MEIFQHFNDIIVVLSFISNIMFIIIPLIVKMFRYLFIKRYIKLVLGYTKEPVQLYHSLFEFETRKNSTNTFLTYASLKAIDNIINLFNIVNQKFDLINTKDDSCNEMNIGGFMTNKRVNTYLCTYFKSFKFVSNFSYKEENEKFPINQKIIEYTDGKYGYKFGDAKFLEGNRDLIDYAFLIKLTGSDFKDNYKKTVHILFGGRDIGAIKATEYLLTHCKQIYHKYGKKHYFFAIPINAIDNTFDYKTGIIDLTDIMFN